MNGFYFFIGAIAIVLIVATTVIVVDFKDRPRDRADRQNTVNRLYVSCKRERAVTHIIDHGHDRIVGDGPWISTQAKYAPRSALIRDMEEPRGA